MVNFVGAIIITLLYWALEYFRTVHASKSRTAHPYFKLLLFFLLLMGTKPLLPLEMQQEGHEQYLHAITIFRVQIMLCYSFLALDYSSGIIGTILVCLLSEIHSLFVSFTSLDAIESSYMVVAFTWLTICILPLIAHSKSRRDAIEEDMDAQTEDRQ